ncbi:MAG: enoyl-CoA hydratase/isomerase family protein [Candidatus Dormibacteria bacterium]
MSEYGLRPERSPRADGPAAVGGSVVVEELAEGSVLVITLNRPSKLNALSWEMIDLLKESLGRASVDESVRTVVLAGAGPSFCAGDDLNGMGLRNGREPSMAEELAVGHLSVVRQMRALEKPVVASLQGYVLGAGFELALAADLRVAGDSAQMGVPYAARGMAGGTALLPWVLGPSLATEMLMLGSMLSARKALALGVVQTVVGDGECVAAALGLAKSLERNSQQAIGYMKRGLSRQWESVFGRGLEVDQHIGLLAGTDGDQVARVQAFLEGQHRG